MVSIKNNLSCNQARREKLPLTKVLLQAGLDVEVRPEKVLIGLFYTGNRKKNLLFHE